MGGGAGGGGGPAYSYTSNIPKWAESAHKELLGTAQEYAYGMGYPIFRDSEGNRFQRIEGWTPQEQFVFAQKQAMAEGGDPYAQGAASMATSAAARPGTMQGIGSNYMGMGAIDPGRFTDAGAASAYMNPYWQNVAQQEIDAARQEYADQRMSTEAQRVARGSRGGYRAEMDDRFSRMDEAETVGDIMGKQAERAFGNAQQQYERDRSAFFRAAQMGDAAEQERTRRQMEASKYNQDMILQQAQAERESAKLLSGLGQQAQSSAYERLKQLEQAGASQRELLQAERDMQYEQAWEQAMWPQRQLNWYQGIVGGAPQGVVQPKTSSPGIVSQLAGLGLTGAALSKALG